MRNNKELHNLSRIVSKELNLFFASPIAYLFLGLFLAITLFVFFWIETFFARNIADIRPLFLWLPIVMIFLCSALTMRMWSEERRTGTLEFVHTLPIHVWRFVLGKFLACVVLLTIALVLTFPLPIMVSIIAELDWGIVITAYFATILLGAMYISIGLLVSARTDNQIVSLLLSALLCGLLYLPGTPMMLNFVDTVGADYFRKIASGSRFEAIARGVIDLRDIYYYLSIIIACLSINVLILERQRWSTKTTQPDNQLRHRQWLLLTGLLVGNALFANLWLDKIHQGRFDVTQNQQFSLSKSSRDYLSQLQEPLIIRGYFTAKTHPLLAPLVPQIQDLIREFGVLGNDKVRIEFIDPASDPKLEEEANSLYGVRATPFQVSDRYQAGLVNSYFDVVVQYGDKFEVLSFRDLIEIRVEGEADLAVKLRNPEYDLTNAIRKVLYSFQSGGNAYLTLTSPLNFTAYISSDKNLPKKLIELETKIKQAIAAQSKKSQGKLQVKWIDPQQPDQLAALTALKSYGFKPMTTSIIDPKQFYFYMTLEQSGSDDGKIMQIPFPEDLKIETFERNFNVALQNFAEGFTRHVTLVVPEIDQYAAQFGKGSRKFMNLTKHLQQTIAIAPDNLKSGQVPSNTDVLLIISPENFNQQQLFAVDQFLMSGGTVIMATSPFSARLEKNQLSVTAHLSGVDAWLKSMGVSMGKTLIMDERSTAFPIPVTRKVGDYSFQEVSMLDYPYFIDIRGDAMNRDTPITASLNQLTVTWASPIDITLPKDSAMDSAAGSAIEVTPLLYSSNDSWLSSSLDVMPKVKPDGSSAFSPSAKQQKYLLAAALSGKFTSFFKNKSIPVAPVVDTDSLEKSRSMLPSARDTSSSSARLIVFSSNEFLTDQTLGLEAAVTGSEYLPPLDLLANAIEWAIDDSGLANIRSRSQFGNNLPPLSTERQRWIEYGTYAASAVLLGMVMLLQTYFHRRRLRCYQQWLAKPAHL